MAQKAGSCERGSTRSSSSGGTRRRSCAC